MAAHWVSCRLICNKDENTKIYSQDVLEVIRSKKMCFRVVKMHLVRTA